MKNTWKDKAAFLFITIIAIFIVTMFINIFRPNTYDYIPIEEPFMSDDLMEFMENHSRGLVELQVDTRMSATDSDILVFRLINNTNDVYVYGVESHIYIREDNRWRRIGFDPSAVIPPIAYLLYPNSYDLIRINSNYSYLPNGEYRLLKGVFRQDDPHNNEIIVVGAFTIE